MPSATAAMKPPKPPCPAALFAPAAAKPKSAAHSVIAAKAMMPPILRKAATIEMRLMTSFLATLIKKAAAMSATPISGTRLESLSTSKS